MLSLVYTYIEWQSLLFELKDTDYGDYSVQHLNWWCCIQCKRGAELILNDGVKGKNAKKGANSEGLGVGRHKWQFIEVVYSPGIGH